MEARKKKTAYLIAKKELLNAKETLLLKQLKLQRAVKKQEKGER